MKLFVPPPQQAFVDQRSSPNPVWYRFLRDMNNQLDTHSHAGIVAAAGTVSATSGTLAFSNSNGVSFGISGQTLTASRADIGVTAVGYSQSANTLFFANSNGITFGADAGGDAREVQITASHNGLTTAAQSNHSHGNPTLALTNLTGTTASNSAGLTLSLSAAAPGGGAAQSFSAGTTSYAPNPVYLSNLNGVSFGFGAGASTSVLTASHNGLTTAAQVSHSHGNPTLALTNLTGTTASASNGFTLSLSAAAPGGGAGIDRQYIEVMEGDLLTHACSITGASFSKRPILVPFWMDGSALSCATVDFWASRAAGTTLNMTMGLAFYSMANSTSLALAASTSHGISLTASAQYSGVRRYRFTGMNTFTLSEGRWVAALYFSGSNNSTAVANLVLYGGQTMFAVNGVVHAGTNSTGATTGTDHVLPWWGVFGATTAAFPAGIARSSVSGQGSNAVNADVYMVIKEV